MSDVTVYLGTAGFKYKDWRGTFYPQSVSDDTMLEYYATRFDLLELDFTYYRLPSEKIMTSFAGRTPDHFLFSVKAHQSMTHEISDDLNQVCTEFSFALQPLQSCGKLATVLLQYPYRFRATRDNCLQIMRIRELLPDVPLTVEFRRGEWVAGNAFSRTLNWLQKLNISYCCVDQPRLRGLLPPVAGASSSTAYVRFHGRNSKKWWDHDHAWQRYHYLYSENELKPWTTRIAELSKASTKVLVVFNNHYGGNAPANADMMKKLIGQTHPELNLH